MDKIGQKDGRYQIGHLLIEGQHGFKNYFNGNAGDKVSWINEDGSKEEISKKDPRILAELHAYGIKLHKISTRSISALWGLRLDKLERLVARRDHNIEQAPPPVFIEAELNASGKIATPHVYIETLEIAPPLKVLVYNIPPLDQNNSVSTWNHVTVTIRNQNTREIVDDRVEGYFHRRDQKEELRFNLPRLSGSYEVEVKTTIGYFDADGMSQTEESVLYLDFTYP